MQSVSSEVMVNFAPTRPTGIAADQIRFAIPITIKYAGDIRICKVFEIADFVFVG